jgi:ferric-dicitrate binding protein FerR (iron transport regulator)
VSIPRYARLAAKLLLRERESVPRAAPPTAANRDAVVVALERAIILRGRRQRLGRAAYASLGAAAVVALAWFARESFPHAPSSDHTSGATVAEQSQSVVVHSFGGGARISGNGATRNQIRPGGRIQALPNGHALLAFATGTRVSVEPGGDVTLVENGAAQILALDHGAMRADVAKLAPGRRFLVHTTDTEVEVHGTSFRVSTETDAARCGTRPLTRVQVFEGVVTVRNAGVESRIENGGQWQAACSTLSVVPAPAVVSAPASKAPTTDSGVHHEVPARKPASSPRARTASLSPTHSELMEQNDAFAAAVSAEQAGDLARAIRGFDGLLSRFPDGPLAESAAVQRLKLAHRFDRRRALELAREYLEHYPAGFAREQAMAIVAESP